MYNLDREFIHSALRVIVDRIETCGASEELTNAVSLTSDLAQAVGNNYLNPDPYALIRVAKAIDDKVNQE